MPKLVRETRNGVNPAGSGLVFSGYVSGSTSISQGHAIALGPTGRVYGSIRSLRNAGKRPHENKVCGTAPAWQAGLTNCGRGRWLDAVHGGAIFCSSDDCSVFRYRRLSSLHIPVQIAAPVSNRCRSPCIQAAHNLGAVCTVFRELI